MDSRPPVSHIPRAVGLTEAACGAGLPPGWEELRPVGNKVTALFITPPPPREGPLRPQPQHHQPLNPGGKQQAWFSSKNQAAALLSVFSNSYKLVNICNNFRAGKALQRNSPRHCWQKPRFVGKRWGPSLQCVRQGRAGERGREAARHLLPASDWDSAASLGGGFASEPQLSHLQRGVSITAQGLQ